MSFHVSVPGLGGLRVGIAGYSGAKFDEEKAKEILAGIFGRLPADAIIVSGATDMGIPALAYRMAVERGMKTVGIMCADGFTCERFPVDLLVVSGKDWGDESPAFLGAIDELYCVGGGKQTNAEMAAAMDMGKPVHAFKLDRLA